MNRKIKKRHIDYSCGFPVVLLNIPMLLIQGQWIVDIDYDTLAKTILICLAKKTHPLTGNEIRFIRYYFGLTARDFGQRFGVKHPTVLKWEHKLDKAATVTWGIEKDIRLFILDRMCQSHKDFREGYKALEHLQEEVELSKVHPLTFELQDGHLLMAC